MCSALGCIIRHPLLGATAWHGMAVEYCTCARLGDKMEKKGRWMERRAIDKSPRAVAKERSAPTRLDSTRPVGVLDVGSGVNRPKARRRGERTLLSLFLCGMAWPWLEQRAIDAHPTCLPSFLPSFLPDCLPSLLIRFSSSRGSLQFYSAFRSDERLVS